MTDPAPSVKSASQPGAADSQTHSVSGGSATADGTGPVVVYKIYIPEFGTRKPFHSILPCPERIYVAWHKDARGIHDLLDENGHTKYGHAPQHDIWQVRTYNRAIHYPETREAFYTEAAPSPSAGGSPVNSTVDVSEERRPS